MRAPFWAVSLLFLSAGPPAEGKIFPFEYRLVRSENGFLAYLIRAGAPAQVAYVTAACASGPVTNKSPGRSPIGYSRKKR